MPTTIAPFINPIVSYGGDAQDWTAEAQSLQRKRSVSDALLKRSLDPISVPVAKDNTQLSSAISPFAALAKLGETYLANKGGENVDNAELSLAGRYKAAENKAIADFTQGDTNDTKHLLTYAQSQYPTVRAAALEMLKEQQKGVIRPKDLLHAPDTTVASRTAAAQSGDVTKLEQKPEFKDVPEGGTLIQATPGNPAATTTVLDKGKQYEKNADGTPKLYDVDANGTIVKAQREIGTGKLEPVDKANKISVSNQLDAGQKGINAGAEGVWKQAAEVMGDLGKQARAARGTMESVTRLRALEDKGIYSGSGAGFKTFATNVADTVGGMVGIDIPKDLREKMGNSQTFNSVGIEAWQQLVGQMGGNRGVTAQEAEKIRLIVPQLKNSPEARRQMYDILENASVRASEKFRNANTEYMKALKSNDPTIWQAHMDKIFDPTGDTPVQPSVKPKGLAGGAAAGSGIDQTQNIKSLKRELADPTKNATQRQILEDELKDAMRLQEQYQPPTPVHKYEQYRRKE